MPTLVCTLTGDYIPGVCGRVIQSSGPLRYAIVDGMNVRDSRVHNYPPRWNGAPSQELLVIRRNHQTGEISLDPLRWGLIPYWCNDPKGGRKPINAKYETVRDLPTSRCVPEAAFGRFPLWEKQTQRHSAAEQARKAEAASAVGVISMREIAAKGLIIASARAIILRQRLLGGAFFGLMATYEAAHCCSDYAVMASIMANDTSNDRALQATFG
jgi:SOS response associated peptidase (SRAP)